MIKKVILKNRVAIFLGLAMVSFLAWVYISSFPPIEKLATEVNSTVYDLMLRANLNKLPPIKNNNIAIIAIDDKSIAEQGRWPWSRKKIAQLVDKLHKQEVSVIAFDIIFSESERNIILETIDELDNIPASQNSNIRASLQELVPHFDYDIKLGQMFKGGEEILGIVFNTEKTKPVGMLPSPILTLPEKELKSLSIPKMGSYLGNIAILQTDAVNGGFINSDPDPDGTLRQSYLIFSYKNGVYASLALEAIRVYLLSDKIQLVTASYDGANVLEGVQMDEVIIPTDEQGRILIPFRARAYAYPYFSATDILENRVAKENLAGKLIFIGATATGLGDLQPSAVGSNYPGVEVHATIASAILDQYFPSKPVWGRGLEFALILIVGLLASLIFPLLSAYWLALIVIVMIGSWFFIITLLWVSYEIILTLLFPLFTVVALAFVNMVNSYVSASRQRKEVESMFGQYVPQQHIETILKSSGEMLLTGESKDLTVLFSDIRGFTTMSEKMSATDLKMQLNEYLTAMTGVIFELDGTIDKYVGDMIMAFWNAPLTDIDHAKKCVLAGLEMQRKLHEVNKYFVEKNLPPIAIGVGINSGMINVGDMGSKFRRAYTAIGDAVNLASRLEGMCRPYEVEVLVGEATYKTTKDIFVYMHVDKVKVKGKNQGVDIYLPLGLREDVSAEQLKEVDEYHQALEHYFKQEWELAEQQFNTLVSDYPERILYTIYVERLQLYRQTPPAQDWDGAYVSTSK